VYCKLFVSVLKMIKNGKELRYLNAVICYVNCLFSHRHYTHYSSHTTVIILSFEQQDLKKALRFQLTWQQGFIQDNYTYLFRSTVLMKIRYKVNYKDSVVFNYNYLATTLSKFYYILIKSVTRLGHQGRPRVFWESPKFFQLCPIVLNYFQHFFPGDRKIF